MTPDGNLVQTPEKVLFRATENALPFDHFHHACRRRYIGPSCFILGVVWQSNPDGGVITIASPKRYTGHPVMLKVVKLPVKGCIPLREP